MHGCGTRGVGETTTGGGEVVDVTGGFAFVVMGGFFGVLRGALLATCDELSVGGVVLDPVLPPRGRAGGVVVGGVVGVAVTVGPGRGCARGVGVDPKVTDSNRASSMNRMKNDDAAT